MDTMNTTTAREDFNEDQDRDRMHDTLMRLAKKTAALKSEFDMSLLIGETARLQDARADAVDFFLSVTEDTGWLARVRALNAEDKAHLAQRRAKLGRKALGIKGKKAKH